MAFELPALAYSYDALEPHIDARTMEIHHSKHHQAYVNNANAALAKHAGWSEKSAEAILADIGAVPEDIRTAVRNNVGGHHNHALFWSTLSPNGGGEPTGALADAIASKFGSFADAKQKLKDAGASRFGSGWGWLVVSKDGDLVIYSTPNQDSPLMEGHTPIFGIDVWEHAYYLKYQNRRPDYLEAIFQVVDWAKVGELYLAARK